MLLKAVVRAIVTGLIALACKGGCSAQEALPGEVVKPPAWEVAWHGVPPDHHSGDVVPEEAGPTPRAAEQKIPLARPDRSGRANRSTSPTPVTRPSVLSIVGSLMLVCGLFVALMWLIRQTMPRSQAPLPAGVVRVLGRATLTGRHILQLLQVGKKLVLVVVGPNGVQTVTEVSDDDEVNRLLGICQQNQRGSITASFRQILRQHGDGADGTTGGTHI